MKLSQVDIKLVVFINLACFLAFTTSETVYLLRAMQPVTSRSYASPSF